VTTDQGQNPLHQFPRITSP